MKIEPLRNEIYTLSELRKINELDGDKELIFALQVKEAVEWLKEEIRPPTNIHYNVNEERKRIFKLIDKAFEDVVK